MMHPESTFTTEAQIVKIAKPAPLYFQHGLILERARERRGKEQPILAGILPDCRLDVAASQRIRRSATAGLAPAKNIGSGEWNRGLIASETERASHEGREPQPSNLLSPST